MTCPTDVLTAKTKMPPAAANASSAARTAVTTYPTGRWPRAWRAADGKLTDSPYRDNLGRIWDAVGRVANGYRASVRLEWGDSGVDRDDRRVSLSRTAAQRLHVRLSTTPGSCSDCQLLDGRRKPVDDEQTACRAAALTTTEPNSRKWPLGLRSDAPNETPPIEVSLQ